MTVRVYSSISQDTTLASGGISAVATSMTVAAGTGNSLMGGIVLVTGDIFTVAIDPDTVNEEIVYITAQSSDTFTITRAQAGTSGVVHADGATVRHVLSSADLTYFRVGVETADAAVPKSTLTTKGDLLSRTSSAVTRVAVGTNGQVLTADSTQTAGIKWSDAATGDVTLNGVQTLTNKTLTSPVINDARQNITINPQTGTTYTPVLTDNGRLVTLSNSSAITVTVPTDASVAYATGAIINLQAIGTGQVTVTGDTGVTVTGTGTKLRTQYSAASLVKMGTNSWTLIGDIQ